MGRYDNETPEHRAARLAKCRENTKHWARYNYYGVGPGMYSQLLVRANNRCEICKILPTKRDLAIDHCHVTKQIRGLLCGQCNSGIGYFKDNPQLLIDAIIYLQRPTLEPEHKQTIPSPKAVYRNGKRTTKRIKRTDYYPDLRFAASRSKRVK